MESIDGYYDRSERAFYGFTTVTAYYADGGKQKRGIITTGTTGTGWRGSTIFLVFSSILKSHKQFPKRFIDFQAVQFPILNRLTVAYFFDCYLS